MTASQQYEEFTNVFVDAVLEVDLDENKIQRLLEHRKEFKKYLVKGLLLFSTEQEQGTQMSQSVQGHTHFVAQQHAPETIERVRVEFIKNAPKPVFQYSLPNLEFE